MLIYSFTTYLFEKKPNMSKELCSEIKMIEN